MAVTIAEGIILAVLGLIALGIGVGILVAVLRGTIAVIGGSVQDLKKPVTLQVRRGEPPTTLSIRYIELFVIIGAIGIAVIVAALQISN